MLKKSKKMIEVEGSIGKPLEEVLPTLVTELGLTGAAKKLGLGKATLNYWLLKFGISVRRVALRPGDSLEISTR
tara:strand:+ start:829 stop:1050 length:222 start_codon:yes stop_codon:yes gene_type:complete